MASVPTKVVERLVKGIKKFQPILVAAKSRDDGEADTCMIVIDMLDEVFGYNKFSEVTAEYRIRCRYCDLATKIDGILQALIEVKAIGLDLKDPHVDQAVNYAANQGVDWVVLTNGICWRIYKVTFAKPIDHELVVEIDFCALDPKNESDVEMLFLWCKEGWVKSVLSGYHTKKEASSRFFLGAMILSDPFLQVIRKELRKIFPEVRIEVDQIRQVLSSEVLKREVMEGEKAEEATKKIARAANKSLRAKAAKEPTEPTPTQALPASVESSQNVKDDQMIKNDNELPSELQQMAEEMRAIRARACATPLSEAQAKAATADTTDLKKMLAPKPR